MENETLNYELDIVRQEKNMTTNKYAVVIKHPVVDGTGTAETRLPREVLTNTPRLRDELAAAGAPLLDDLKKEANRLLKMTDIPTVCTTDMGEWHGDILVSRHGIFTEEGGEIGKDIYQFNPDNPLFCPAKQKGTRKAYDSGLKTPQACSRYLQFIIAVALAAPLGAFLGREGGPAFNFSGKSSRGKTLSLLTNLSIVTEPTEASLLSLASTPTFFTNFQMSFRATSVPFSDMKTFMGKKEALFEVLRLIVFNNHDRPVRHTAVSSNVREKGFSIPLFSSESPLREIFNSKKLSLEAGDLVRLIDITVPEDTGIFDKIPAESNTSGAELARITEETIKNNYGHHLQPWVNCLVSSERHYLEKEVKVLEDRFIKSVTNNALKNDSPLKPEEIRIAKSFAFIAAAGSLAAREKLFQVDRKEVFRSILFLFQKAVAETKLPEDILLYRVKEFQQFALNRKSFPLIREGQEVMEEHVPNGFRGERRGKMYLFVYPDAMDRFHNGEFNLKSRLYHHFLAKGALIKMQPDEWTVSVKQKGLGKVRMLKFVLSKIGD